MTAWVLFCVQTDLPAFTAYDAKSIQAIAAECDIDYVALTYTCDESDVVCHIWPRLHVSHPLSNPMPAAALHSLVSVAGNLPQHCL